MILKGMVQAWNLRMYLQTIGCHFLLFDNDFSIFTEGKDLQPLDFKISGFAVCNVLFFTEQNRKKFHLADKKLGKKSLT